MEAKNFKVKIGDVVKEVQVKPLTGRDQLEYVKVLKVMADADPEEVVKAQNKLIATATGLTEDEILDMNLEDKDTLGNHLMTLNLSFAKGFRDFLKS